MTRWNLSLAGVDYLAMRRQQLGRDPSDYEIRAVHGFIEYCIALETLQEHEPPCSGTHEAADLMDAARLMDQEPT